MFARGQLPCDLLFVGEAPGVSEDVLGLPFVGPAGKLLDEIVKRSIVGPIRIAFYNLIGCFPRDGKKIGDHTPSMESIEACSSRLREFVALAKPRLVVCVGALAAKWLPKILAGKNVVGTIAITHPAAILRTNHAFQSLEAQKCVATIADAMKELR